MWIEDQRRQRLLVEVEELAQVPEDRHVLADGGPGVGPLQRGGVQTLAAQEQVLDQLQVGVERERLVSRCPVSPMG